MSIKMLVMDVDGTLTDGKVYYDSEGREQKAFDIKDGYGIKHILPANGVIPVIITGRESAIVARRAKELGIDEVHQGVIDKITVMKRLMEKYGLTKSDIAYIGDDILDIYCMKNCELVGCPRDAIEEVMEIADYVCKRNGGDGAVREFIEYLVRQ